MQACWLLLLLGLTCGRAAKLGPPTRVQLGEGVAKDDFYTTQIKLRGEQRAVRRPIIGPVNRCNTARALSTTPSHSTLC